jgi:hypothetical protein
LSPAANEPAVVPAEYDPAFTLWRSEDKGEAME